MRVVELDASDTYNLRRLVLRSGDSEAVVAFVEDDHPDAFHLGIQPDSGDLVAVASFSPQHCAPRSGASALQLRGMAVVEGVQRTGVGRILIQAGLDRARKDGHQVLWANARDSAVGFYQGMGMTVHGDGFLTATGIPHHLVLIDL